MDDDFLNVGLNDLISQTPPMDYQHELPDTPVSSVLPITTNDDADLTSTIEQLFSMQHEPLPTPPSHQIVQVISDSNLKPSFTKCIVVTQDFLQSMYNQPQPTVTSTNTGIVYRRKRRPRRFKVGKENHYQQRKIMPRASPDRQ